MRRPVGISVLGGLVLLAAVILVLISIASFIVGLAFLLPFPNGGPTLPGTQLLLNAVLYFVIGVVLAIAGSGLLRMRVWAYGLAVLATLVTLVYVGYTAYQRSNSGEALSLAAILTLGIVGARAGCLVHDDRSARLLHGRQDRRRVQGYQRAQVDDLRLDALLRGLRRRVEAHLGHVTVRY